MNKKKKKLKNLQHKIIADKSLSNKEKILLLNLNDAMYITSLFIDLIERGKGNGKI